MIKRTATPAAAGLAARTEEIIVQTSARPVAAPPRDEFTGLGGTYLRDPATGKRTRMALPEALDGAAIAVVQPQHP